MPDAILRFVNIRDRPMITVDLDVSRYLHDGRWDVPENLRGAIVRVRGEATESEAEQLAAGGQRLLRAITDQLKAGGAHKVIGPKLKIVREKRVRSDVTADTDPRSALDRFLVEREVDEGLRARVIELAETVMGA
jgi:hypothetical protein